MLIKSSYKDVNESQSLLGWGQFRKYLCAKCGKIRLMPGSSAVQSVHLFASRDVDG